MARYKSGFKVGVLGGGQLARMLAESAFRMGLEAHIYSESPTDPAAQTTGFWHKGSLTDSGGINNFVAQMDSVTFESEFIDTSLVKPAGKKLFPQPKIMALLQDRKTQKMQLDKYNLPTSPWAPLSTAHDLERLMDTWKSPVVCKKRLGGYDGYGTFVIKTQKQKNDFLKNHFSKTPFIAEKFIPFRRECALIAARSRDKSFSHFPLVESFQKDSRCFWIKGPVKNQKLTAMVRKIKNMLDGLNYVGVMGVEFFETKDGLMINELAPRVHNTGHYSQNTNGPSQFDIHWLCQLGHTLPKTLVKDLGFAMVNLLGTGSKSPHFTSSQESWIHWYGKMESRKGRKMGHVNAVAKTPNLALKKVLLSEKGCRV